MAYLSFTDLEIWKKARSLKNEIFELTKTFPESEKFCLTIQMIRCSRSINANIAEGHGRYSYKDQLHFCMQARGSLYETSNHFFDAFDCKYISAEQLEEYNEKVRVIVALLNGYITYLRKNIKQAQ